MAIIGFALIIGLGIIVFVIGGGAGIKNNAILVCFGDSLTAGMNATVLGEDDKSKSYPSFLQDRVKIQVINAGVSGDKTSDGLSRIQDDVINKKPSIVIVEFGANDYFGDVGAAEIQNNLESIITLLKRNNGNVKIYLAKFYNDAVASAFSIQPSKRAEYDAMFYDLKAAHNIEIIEDIWAGVWGTENMSQDNTHPLASGYQIMAENIFNAIRPFLQTHGMLK